MTAKHDRATPSILGEDREQLLLDVSRQIALEDMATIFGGGISATEAVDFWAVDVCGLTYREWSDVRDVTRTTVDHNVSKARSKLTEGAEE